MYWLNFREPFCAWSHAFWLALSIPATILLWRRGNSNPMTRLSLLVFGVSLGICSLGSTLFHGVNVAHPDLDRFERLDHVGIHLLIAGTYTPLAWNLLGGRWRWGTLVLVWATTIVASALLLAEIKLPRALATAKYLALGWGALFCYVEMARVLPHRVLAPLVLGGLCYSVGAVLNLINWPVPWPGVVDAHGVFHLWVVAGSSAHFWFMLTAVIPFAEVVHGRSAYAGLVDSRPDHPSRHRASYARTATAPDGRGSRSDRGAD